MVPFVNAPVYVPKTIKSTRAGDEGQSFGGYARGGIAFYILGVGDYAFVDASIHQSHQAGKYQSVGAAEHGAE